MINSGVGSLRKSNDVWLDIDFLTSYANLKELHKFDSVVFV